MFVKKGKRLVQKIRVPSKPVNIVVKDEFYCEDCGIELDSGRLCGDCRVVDLSVDCDCGATATNGKWCKPCHGKFIHWVYRNPFANPLEFKC